jgi:hypothetical protein
MLNPKFRMKYYPVHLALRVATIVRGKQEQQGVLDEVATHSSMIHSTGGWPSVLTFLDFAVEVTSPFNCLCISYWSV